MRIEHKVIIEIVIASEEIPRLSLRGDFSHRSNLKTGSEQAPQSRFLHRDCHTPILSGLAMTEKY